MEISKSYLILFTDSFCGNLIFCLNNELILHSIGTFNTYKNINILTISTMAALIANSINYFIGYFISKFFNYSKNIIIKTQYDRFFRFFNKESHFIIILSLIPFWGKIIPLVLGFFNVKIIRILIIFILLKFVYNIFIIYIN